jgi:transposase-like protein
MARKRFTAGFKTNVVLTLLKEEKQISEVAAEHEISPINCVTGGGNS